MHVLMICISFCLQNAIFMTQKIFVVKLSPMPKSVSNNNGESNVGKMYSSFLRNGDPG